MKILISAAEASSDAHGAELLAQLRKQLPAGTPLEVFGIGGPKLQAAGLETVVDARELLSMGFIEVLGRLPRILGALKRVSDEAQARKPDVAVVIDYPDFHFRLARRLKAFGIPVVYYIPPKVWAWRKGRVKVLRELFTRVLSILPFETEFFKKAGLPVKYVGNPLLDELPLTETRAGARAKLALGESDRVLLLMPGSRPAELKHHLESMLDATVRGAAKLRASGWLKGDEGLKVLIPFPATADFAAQEARISNWLRAGGWDRNPILQVRASQGNAAIAMLAADAGLVKSGTSTLEAAILGCPHAVIYRGWRVSWWIFKYLVRYRGPVGLVNLVAGGGKPYLAHELLGPAATVDAMSDEVVALLSDSRRRAELAQGFEGIRKTLFAAPEGASTTAHGPSARAAEEVLAVAAEARGPSGVQAGAPR